MSPSKFSGVTLRDGDQVKILMPGGGGYGDPLGATARSCGATSRRASSATRRRARVYGLEDGGDVGEWKRPRSRTSRRTARPATSAGTRSRAATGAPTSTARSSCSARPTTSGCTTTTGSPATERRGRLTMTRNPVLSQEAPQPSGGYSQGIVAGASSSSPGRARTTPPGRGSARRSPSRCGRCSRTSTRSPRPPAVRCRTRCAGHVHQRHGALRRDGCRSTAASSPIRSRARDDDPVGSRRLRRRGRRCRLAGRLTPRGDHVARHAGRDDRPRRRRAQHRADAGYCDEHGLAFRPHIKTHKLPAIAYMQLRAGAVGITCQKLGEAEVMEAAGLRDILLSFPLVGPPRRSASRPSQARLRWRSSATRRPWPEALACTRERGREVGFSSSATPASAARACRQPRRRRSSPSSSTRCPACASKA